MSNPIASNDLRTLLATHAKTFYDRGWMWGTAGNLSARLPDSSFWITASGCSKGELTPEQFVRMSLDGNLLERPTPSAKPSAETSIHQAVYGLFPEAQACYHVHSVPANLVSRSSATPQILLPAIEMLKGMGVWDKTLRFSWIFFPTIPMSPKLPTICAIASINLRRKSRPV